MFWYVVPILAAAFYAWVKWKLEYWNRHGVPSPQAHFVVGNIWRTLTLQEHMGVLSAKWYKDFPNIPYVGFYKMLRPAVVLRDPNLIIDVMTRHWGSFHVNDFPVDAKRDPLAAVNPFFNAGEAWKRGRSILVPIFSASKTKSIFPDMAYACNNFREYLLSAPKGKDFDAKALCANFATENVFKCAFSIDAGCFRSGRNEFREVGKTMFKPSIASGLQFMIAPLLPKWLLKLIPIPMIPEDTDAWFRSLVRENRIAREGLDFKREDFMQMLIDSQEKHDTHHTEMVGHTVSLFMEGFETSSTVLSFALYELARTPEWQDRLHQEVIDVLEKHNNNFTYEALQDMVLVDCAVQETMRLHPVMLQFQKICTEEYTLPKFGIQKEGVTIYPGTSVIIPIQAIHCDPNNFRNPTQFNPERFVPDERRNRHKAHFMPFGEGPRMCMGWRFGLTQVKAAVVTIVRDFKVSVAKRQQPIRIHPMSFLKQTRDGLWLNFEPRTM